MTCVNAENERLKRRYFEYMREARGRSPKTIEIARLALAQYDRFTSFKAYQRFATEDAKGFKRKLLEGDAKRRSELSSRSGAHSTLTQVQNFFRWLAGQPGYKTRGHVWSVGRAGGLFRKRSRPNSSDGGRLPAGRRARRSLLDSPGSAKDGPHASSR